MSKNDWPYSVIRFLASKLFEREWVRIANAERQVIKQNTELGGSPDGFVYLDRTYSALESNLVSMGNYSYLHYDLIPEMKLILEDKEEVNQEHKRIVQALNLILKGTRTFQDVRDALPNSLASILPECASLERTRPEAYTLEDNPRALRQYQKLREKIDYYAAARMIY